MSHNVPSSEQIIKAMEVAQGSIEAANYLVEKVHDKLTKAKVLDKSSDYMAAVEKFAERVVYLRTLPVPIWTGQQVPASNFQIMHTNYALDAASKVVGHLQQEGVQQALHLDFAISDNAELVRGYSAGAVPFTATEEEDTLFNSWLASHNMISQGSVIYHADAEGNNAGAVQDVERLRHLVTDPSVGFSKFMQDKGITVTVQQHAFPDQTNTEQMEQSPEAETSSGIRTK